MRHQLLILPVPFADFVRLGLLARAELVLGDLDGFEQGLGLVHRLFVFAGGDGIGDDAGANLHVVDAVPPDDRAQGDAGVHVAGKIEGNGSGDSTD